MLDDYLGAEAIIKARLSDQIPELRAVLSAADLAQVTEATQVTPAAYVLYDGDDVLGGATQRAGNGGAQVVIQRWIVVLAIRNVSDQRGGSGARSEAGPYMAKIIQALSGWQPGGEYRSIRRAGAPRPGYSAGYGYFPISFTVEIITIPA